VSWLKPRRSATLSRAAEYPAERLVFSIAAAGAAHTAAVLFVVFGGSVRMRPLRSLSLSSFPTSAPVLRCLGEGASAFQPPSVKPPACISQIRHPFRENSWNSCKPFFLPNSKRRAKVVFRRAKGMKRPANITTATRPKGRGIRPHRASAGSLGRRRTDHAGFISKPLHASRNDAVDFLGSAAASAAVRCASRRTFAAWQSPDGRSVSSARVSREGAPHCARGGRAPLSTASLRLTFPALAVQPGVPLPEEAKNPPESAPARPQDLQAIHGKQLTTLPSAPLFQAFRGGYIGRRGSDHPTWPNLLLLLRLDIIAPGSNIARTWVGGIS
jgi:hypothetical protein